ncbi:carbohydrate ABC transporter permease [Paenibacillus cymbidii]|uniref:carbohydrate ABC transporter permease n=1 Tax=Paenibacillus cymbidii TaxID=1639034 RepID=UPI0010807625|nr:carbohydrate ABC transporter permease [Paenibacillus cymbidii]
MRIRHSRGERTFDIVNVLLMLLACAAIILPVLHVAAGSLSSTNALIHMRVKLWPVEWNFDNYKLVINNSIFWRSFRNTLFVVIVGTAINMLLTILTAYPLSKRGFRGRKLFLLLIVFTIIFQAPIVPVYIIVKSFLLINTLWALIIPAALNAFNLLICMTFFRSLPEEMFEAARVDGMDEMRILWKIAVPLSLPIMVTLILFYAVGNWNNYYLALLYVTKPALKTMQLYLYTMIAQFSMNETDGAAAAIAERSADISPQGLQMATVLVATIPILLVYPFIQKHFVKGALIGSIKE